MQSLRNPKCAMYAVHGGGPCMFIGPGIIGTKKTRQAGEQKAGTRQEKNGHRQLSHQQPLVADETIADKSALPRGASQLLPLELLV